MTDLHATQHEMGVCGCFAVQRVALTREKEIERALRRCAIELAYVNHGVENCTSGLCATGEGEECIKEAERLLGPMKEWPEVKE